MLILLIVICVLALIVEKRSIISIKKHELIDYSCKPSVESAEPDEEFRVYSDVTNLSYRRAPVLRIEERFPKSLNINKLDSFNAVVKDDHRIFTSTVSLKRRQRVRRYLTASIPDRGEYYFSFAEFHAGDFLGFIENDFFKDNNNHIVIYPRKVSDAEFLESFANALDEIVLNKFLLEDPISVCGYREYTGREPMRAISWKQTAIRNELIVKEFDSTQKQSVTVVLDTAYHGEFDYHIRRQEYEFKAARTICEYLEDKSIEYTLITNAIINEGISSFHSTGGWGNAYNRILYGLGCAKNGETCSAELLLADVCSGAFRERTIVFISSRREDALMNLLNQIKRNYGVKFIFVFAEDYVNERTEDEKKKYETQAGTETEKEHDAAGTVPSVKHKKRKITAKPGAERSHE